MNNIILAGKTDVGLKRSKNEDIHSVNPELGICLVADGMGGAAAGEVASNIFKEVAVKIFATSADRSENYTKQLVQTAFRAANEQILIHIKENPEHKGMGCTAELLAFSDNTIILGHIGDSRTYRFRNGEFKQMTRDHSLVQDQIDQGNITVEQARKHPLKNIILRAVGIQENLALDLVTIKPHQNDIFLLCSDGLTDMVDDPTIHKILGSGDDLEKTAENLIQAAKESGGNDNITVVLCKIQ
jgi:protein phosphatase